ncbi:MAG: DUF2059 domain-containing protein [Pseudomonadota bacterium]
MRIGNYLSFAVKTLPAVILATFLAIASAFAQEAEEATPEHIEAAKAAMVATGATARLDKILPELAAFTKTGLIANRPDIESEISTIVDEVAISLAPRRGPLENEVAGIYTKLFSQDELATIETFFGSETGTKFLALTPGLFREIDEAAKVWRSGLTRDMAKMVQEKLREANLQ